MSLAKDKQTLIAVANRYGKTSRSLSMYKEAAERLAFKFRITQRLIGKLLYD